MQVDAKNAYLNTWLKGDIELYMKLLPLYKSYWQLPPELEKEHEVIYKLLAPMYGMKQGAHDWYTNIKRILLTLGYSVSNADEAMFYIFERDKYTIIAATTNSFTIIADSTKLSDLIQNQFSQHFKIVNNSPINWLLGVKLTHSLEAKTIYLSQQAYIEEILIHFGLENVCTAITPMEPRIDLSPNSPTVSPNLLTPAEKTKYCEMIGCLMYATVMMHPDIVFAVSSLSQYCYILYLLVVVYFIIF